MCIEFDGHHSGGSYFIYVNDILFLLYIYIYKQVKSPSSVSRLGTRFGSTNRVGPGFGA